MKTSKRKAILKISAPYTKKISFKVIFTIIKLMFHLYIWEKQVKTKIKLKYKVQLSAYVSIVFIDYLSFLQQKLILDIIIFQRLWDDVYDERQYTSSELEIIKNHVFDNCENDVNIGNSLRNIYLDVLSKLNNMNSSYVNNFIEETKNIIRGYEYEYNLTEENINTDNLSNYLHYSSTTIGLKYIMSAIYIILVKSDKEDRMFNEAWTNVDLASQSIRLANDLAGHKKEKNQLKVDSIAIYMNINKSKYKNTEKFILNQIFINLSQLYKTQFSNNSFNKMISEISAIAIQRYLQKKL